MRALVAACPTTPATVIARRIGWAPLIDGAEGPSANAAPVLSTAGRFDPHDRRPEAPVAVRPVDRAGRRPARGGAGGLTTGAGDGRGALADDVRAHAALRQAPDLMAGRRASLQVIDAVSQASVWENESAVGSWRAGEPTLTDDRGCRWARGRAPSVPAAGAPGLNLVERANGYLETSFLPGARSPVRKTSTPSWPTGWRWRTTTSPGPRAAGRWTAGRPTGTRCARCPRVPRSSAGGAGVAAARTRRAPRLQRLTVNRPRSAVSPRSSRTFSRAPSVWAPGP